MNTVSVNGIEMAYEESGSGAPLLLLHGFALNRDMWKAQAEALEGRYRVLRPDMRGMGGTTHGGGPITIEMMADDMAAFLAALDVGAAAVAGFSMGGYVLLQMAIRHPLRVRACGFISTRAAADTEEGKRARLAQMRAVIDEGMEPFAAHFLPQLFSPGYASVHPIEVEATRRVVAAQVPGHVAALIDANRRREDATPRLGEIAVPCLSFGGTGDALVPPAEMDALCGGLGDSAREMVEGAGHMTPLECAARVSFQLDQLLQRAGMWT